MSFYIFQFIDCKKHIIISLCTETSCWLVTHVQATAPKKLATILLMLFTAAHKTQLQRFGSLKQHESSRSQWAKEVKDTGRDKVFLRGFVKGNGHEKSVISKMLQKKIRAEKSPFTTEQEGDMESELLLT